VEECRLAVSTDGRRHKTYNVSRNPAGPGAEGEQSNGLEDSEVEREHWRRSSA
jgi:hypothetical protein